MNDADEIRGMLGSIQEYVATERWPPQDIKDSINELARDCADYRPLRNKGMNGNDLSGNGCQLNFDMLLITIRTAHYNKVNELRELLSETHWSHSHGYHHHTRGQKIEMLGAQLAMLSQMLWVLQGMNNNEQRLANFHWVFDPVVEESE
jgi:hypothetical protein